MLIGFGLNGVA
jgi:hypothetical protein